MSITLGNDISKFQGDINYDVYRNNTQFVICKASEGTGFKDPKLDRNKSEARRTNILLGYYHFARPDLGNTPQAEADWFLQAIGDFREGELLALDYEANWSGDVVDWCNKFLNRIREKLSGYNALIYLNQSHMIKNWKPVIDAGNGLWIAAYTYDPNKNNFNKGQWPFAAMQQWTSSQNVPGINGNVDGNVFFGDLDTLKKYCYHPAPPADPCADIKKELEQTKQDLTIAQEKLNKIKSIIS
jgi:lysozyme